MSTQSELKAYVLLTVPNASLTTPTGKLSGELALEYVTFPQESSAPTSAPDVFLVLRIGAFETVLDPAYRIDASILASDERRYVLRGTGESADLVLVLPSPADSKASDDIETFHSVLAEYGGFAQSEIEPLADTKLSLDKPVDDKDLRGRFLLVNEDNNEVLGALDQNIRVHEDPVLYEKGHENDPVVVELPEGVDELSETEVMIRTIPPEDRGWMMKGAMFAR
jgi:spartin